MYTDINDIFDMFGSQFFDGFSGASGLLGAIGNLSKFLLAISALYWIVSILLFVAFYFFSGYTLLCIGRKTGIKNGTWMPFVPIANRLYELKMLKRPWWEIFFFKGIGIFLAVLSCAVLYGLLDETGLFGRLISMLVLMGYLAYSVMVTFKWLRRYYAKFGFNPLLAVAYYAPVFSTCVPMLLNVWIAYYNGVVWGENAAPSASRPVAPSPNPVVYSPNSLYGTIIGVTGMYKDATLRVNDKDEVVFGRDANVCHMIFSDTNMDVSRVHCRVSYNAMSNKYIVTDCSKNGTFTGDGRRLQYNIPVPVVRGTEIYLGSKKNSFRLN